MIKAYDTTTLQYYTFRDYTKSLTDATNHYGVKRTITAITEYTASATTTAAPTTTLSSTTTVAGNNIQVTSANHGFLSGQSVALAETTNYDGTYEVLVIDANTFVCLLCEYVADETSGEAYPVMGSDYYFVFMQKIEDIFDKVKHISALRGKAIRDKEGRSLIDDFALSEDRRDTFLMLAREACRKAWAKLSGYGKDIENAFIFNEQIDLDADDSISSDEDDYMVHMAVEIEEDNINVNVFDLVDQNILDSIVYRILADWFRMNGSGDDYMLYNKNAEDALINIGFYIGKCEDHRGVTFKEFF
jgi:hypothetical protein